MSTKKKNKGMKALSIQQPWAWLIVNGYKDVENRTWPTRVRGEIWIHAGKKIDEEGYDAVARKFPHIPLPPKSALQRGGIVGKATITDCVTGCDSLWFSGDFGFKLADAKPVDFIQYPGELGFFVPKIGSAAQ